MNLKLFFEVKTTFEMVTESKDLLLLFGFVRDTKSKEIGIPSDVIESILFKYYLQTIDYFEAHEHAQIDYQNNIFGVGCQNGEHCTYCISQIGWNKGKHKMSIKFVKHNYLGYGFAIGIVTNKKLEKIRSTDWIFDYAPAALTYSFYVH